MSENIKEYELCLISDNKSPKTILAYLNAIEQLKSFYEERNQIVFVEENVTTLDLRDWVESMKSEKRFAPATIQRNIAAVKTYWKYLLEQHYIPTNPAKKIRVKQISVLDHTPRWLTRAEQAKLLHIIMKEKNSIKRHRDYALATTMLQAGLRVAEVSDLDIYDLDNKKNILTVRHGKGDKMRIIPVNKELQKAISAYLDKRAENKEDKEIAMFLSERGHRLTDRGIQYQLRKYFNQLGLTDATTHCLRHSFCKNLINNGVDINIVSQLAGHDNLETTRRYITPSEQELRMAVERICSESEVLV